MRSPKTLVVFALAIVGTFGMAGVAAGQALEDVSAPSPPGPPPNFNVPMWDGPDAILLDNGPLVTHPGGGAGGADASAVQTALGMSLYGPSCSLSTGYRVADDFTVPVGGWNVTTITFFAYQTGSTTTSTINNVNLRIWDDPPNAGGSVIWGDTTTNVLATTQWSNIYRVLDTGLTNTQRPIMANVVTVNTALPAGTYWLDWQVGGTLTSGPWAPPISILGQTTTGNAMQQTVSTQVWANITDGGTLTPQGLPFIIEGTGATGPSISLAKTVGTDPGVCATTSTITVDAGTTVYYCYEVTNTGDVTFTTHDLLDDQLGTIFTGLAYSLAPGASVNTVDAGLSIPAVINTTTTNTAAWVAYVPGGPSAQATDSATVTAIPPRCPAGYIEVDVTAADFEGSFPPAGWTIANNTTNCSPPGVGDWTNTDPGVRGNLTGGVGLFAIADSDACGSNNVMDAQMWTPVLDLTGLIEPMVSYYTDYNDISSASDVADLDVSTDGGATWGNVLSWNEDHRGPLLVEQPIPVAGDNDVVIRWHYSNATWDWWWEVDDVVVTACLPVQTDPNINVNPLSLAATQPPDTVTLQTLTITNTGGEDLTWSLTEVPGLKSAVIKPAPAGTPKSLTGSFVVFDPSAGGDTCYTPGTAGTFCFRAESFSPDWEYVYDVWEKFPTDWTVSNVYVQGTPSCVHGTFGTFSWSFETPPYEVDIYHPRYQYNYPDEHCIAYYCFDAAAGAGPADAGVSWYWDGDGYGNTPHWPCSSDGYTPAGQSACDEMINPLATVPVCGAAGIPWLDENLTSGILLPGQAVVVTVTFDSTGLAPGGYVGDLEIASNDPDPGPGNGTNLVVVPVTLTVISVAEPDIEVTPASLFASQLTNMITQQTLNVGNTGDADLVWTIVEEPVVLAPAGPAPQDARHAPSKVGTSTPRVIASPEAVVFNEGFEGGAVPPAGWSLQVQNAGYTWKIMTAGTPYNGSFSADVEYDPALVPQNEWLLSPEATLSSGTLSFWSYGSVYWCRDDYDNCDLEAWIVVGPTAGDGDDIYVGDADPSWPASWTWAQSVFDLTPLLPGGPVRIGLRYVGVDGAQVAVDDILLDGEVGPTVCASPADVPWLSVSPDNGTTAPGGSSPVDVTFDSTGIALGTYDAMLCVLSNDPDEPIVPVPVTMEVVIPVELMGISVE